MNVQFKIAYLDNKADRLCGLYTQRFFKRNLSQTNYLLKQFPTLTDLYIIFGDAYTKLKQFDDAILHYNKSKDLKPHLLLPTSILVWLNRIKEI